MLLWDLAGQLLHRYDCKLEKRVYAILCTLMVDHFKRVWLDQELSRNSISWNKNKKKKKWKKTCKNVFVWKLFVWTIFTLCLLKNLPKIEKSEKKANYIYMWENLKRMMWRTFHTSASFFPKKRVVKCFFSLNTTWRLFNLYLHLTNIAIIFCQLNFVCVTIWYLFHFHFPCFP